MHLLDINVWLALAFDSHQHHTPAAEWFAAAADDSCAFCRLTQMGFLRLATTPRVLADTALTLEEAWHAYDELCDDPRVVFAEEPEGLEPPWRAFARRQTVSPKIWTDAYLAAFAQAANWELVTFDRGFFQYSGIRAAILH
jgi:toxin-antitoxin system PIN domain toxin